MNQFVKTYKKRVSGVISLLLTICLISSANAEQVLYCTTELATGITKEDGKWVTAPFKKPRYTVKFNSDYTQVEGFRENYPPLNCHAPYDYPSEVLSCSTHDVFLLFNREKLRFTFFHGSAGGYTFSFDLEKPDTDVITAGTCEKF